MYGIIYKITNLANNKVYIGQTIKKMQIRWKEHQSAAKRGINTYFHKAIRKYGIENFIIEQIAAADSKQELDELEIKYIQEYDCLAPNGYNINKGGGNTDNFTNNPNIELIKQHISEGKKRYFANWTEEERKNFSEQCRQRTLDPNGPYQSKEYKEKMRVACTGKKMPEHAKAILKEKFTGREVNKDLRKEWSINRKGKYSGNHWWNDGINQKFCKECPGENWTQGRLNPHWNQRNYKVYCVELDKKFKGYLDAAKFICKIPEDLELTQRRINRACNGKYTEAFGYHWKLLKE